jgi:hypothetical protein
MPKATLKAKYNLSKAELTVLIAALRNVRDLLVNGQMTLDAPEELALAWQRRFDLKRDAQDIWASMLVQDLHQESPQPDKHQPKALSKYILRRLRDWKRRTP